MKLRQLNPSDFYPVELQAVPLNEGGHDGAYDRIVFSHPQRVIQNAAAELARRVFGERSHAQEAGLRQSDLVTLVERIAEAVAAGPDAPAAFSGETRLWLVQKAQRSAPRLAGMERVLRDLLDEGVGLLGPGAYLQFQRATRELLRGTRNARCGALMEGRASELATRALERFEASGEGNWEEGVRERMERELTTFLGLTSQLMMLGSEMEIQTNVCLFWAGRMAGQFAGTREEWMRLGAAVEQVLFEELGADASRQTAPVFSMISAGVERLGFCGAALEAMPQVEAQLSGERGAAHWQGIVEAALGEVLARAADPAGFSLLQWRLLQGDPLFEGLNLSGFRELAGELRGAAEARGDRDGAASLGAVLGMCERTIESISARLMARDAVEAAVEEAARLLKGSEAALEDSESLGEEVGMLWDKARCVSLCYASGAAVLAHLRRWFGFAFAAEFEDGMLRKLSRVARAMGEAIGARTPEGLVRREGERAAALLSETGGSQGEIEFALAAWAAVAEVGSQAGEGRAWTVLRRCLIDVGVHGAEDAAENVLRWLVQEELPYLGAVPTETVAPSFAGVGLLAGSRPELRHEGLHYVVREVVSELPRVVLSWWLWVLSESFGRSIAERVFRLMPDYRARLSEEGQRRCATELAVALRMVALALGPEATDAVGFLGKRWRRSVNWAPRPIQFWNCCEAELVNEIGDRFGAENADVVEGLTRPLFEYAPADEREANVPVFAFRLMAPTFPLTELVASELRDGWLGTLGTDWRNWVVTALVRAAEEAGCGAGEDEPRFTAVLHAGKGDSDAEYVGKNLGFVARTVYEGLPAFEWAGHLSSFTTRSWHFLLKGRPGAAKHLEAILDGCEAGVDQVHGILARVRVADYVQAMKEFHRQSSAGFELAARSSEVAGVFGEGVMRPIRDGGNLGHDEPRLLVETMAAAMTRLGRPAAMLNVLRFLAGRSAVSFQFEAAGWRRGCLRAQEGVRGLLPDEAAREVGGWFGRLAQLGETVTALRGVCQTIAGASSFLPAAGASDDREWRELLVGAAALVLANRCEPETVAGMRVLLCESLGSGGDFPQKVSALESNLGAWFVDSDLTELVRELRLARETSVRAAALKGLVPRVVELSPRFAEAAGMGGEESATGAALMLLTLAKDAGLPTGFRTLWGVPPGVKGMPEGGVRDLLRGGDRMRWIVLNLLSGPALPPDVLASQWTRVTGWLAELPKLRFAWGEAWEQTTTEAERSVLARALDGALAEASEEEAREMVWVARRICMAGWAAGSDSGGLAGAWDWYFAERLAKGRIPAALDTWMVRLMLLCDQIEAKMGLPSLAAETAKRFRESLFCWAAGRRLLADEETVASSVADVAEAERTPESGTDAEELRAVSGWWVRLVARDLTERAGGRGALDGLPGGDETGAMRRWSGPLANGLESVARTRLAREEFGAMRKRLDAWRGE